jgi:PAS domain S-box-containing protein
MKPSTQEELERRLTAAHDALEAAARQGAARFADVFRHPPPGVGVHEIDLEHRIQRVNAEELRILGYSEAEMVGRPPWQFIVMQEASRRAIDRKFGGQLELKPFVRTFRRSDGVGVALLLLDRFLTDSGGGVVGIRTAMVEVPPGD